MDSVLVIRLVLIIADELEDGVFKGPRTAHEALVEVPLEWSKEATPTEGWGFASALTNKPYQTTRCRSVIASLPDGVCLSAGVWRWFGVWCRRDVRYRMALGYQSTRVSSSSREVLKPVGSERLVPKFFEWVSVE